MQINEPTEDLEENGEQYLENLGLRKIFSDVPTAVMLLASTLDLKELQQKPICRDL